MNRSVGVTQTRTSSASRPLPPNPSRGPTTTTTNSSVRTRQSSATRRPSTDSTRVLPQEQRRRSPVNATNESSLSPPPQISSQIETKLMHRGVTGLQNLGNTCFMNSVLQCLSNTKPLLLLCFREDLDSLFNRSSTSAMKGSLMREYAKLIQNMWGGDSRTVVSPQAFKSVVGRFASRFLGYAQQDSQEFLRYLLQGLHEDMNRVQQKPTPIKIDEAAEERLRENDRAERSWQRCLRYDNSPIADIFAGQLKSCLECSVCHHKSITFDMFWDLSIPLPRNKSSIHLNECIQLFMSEEQLDGKEKPLCERCKTKQTCTKKFFIQQCPVILVLHLKRFSESRSRAKLNSLVDFPLNDLCLSDLPDVMSESYEGPKPTYRLFGVSYHSGTTYSGHYVAACRHPFNHQWHDFNDSSAYRIQETRRIVSADAYVLFYERTE